MKGIFALFLAMLMILGSVFAVSAADPSRITVYQEDFEDGIGRFEAFDPELKFEQGVDASGNHYLKCKVDPDKAEAIATYTRAVNQAGVIGDWFWQWPMNYNLTFFKLDNNNRRYQVMLEASRFKNSVFTGGWYSFGTSAYLTATNVMWNNTTGASTNRVNSFADPQTDVPGKQGWKYHATNIAALDAYKFGVTRSGDPGAYTYSGDAYLKYYQFRANLGVPIANLLKTNKYYCGGGLGKTDANNVIKDGTDYGASFKFTLTRSDFYGDEAIFAGATTEEEKNVIKDSYIYETDGTTVKTYSLADDCTFLRSAQRIASFKAALQNFEFVAMDNFKIVANAYQYTDTVSVTGNGSVSALTNPAIDATTAVNSGESKPVTKNDYFGVSYTLTPTEGYSLESVMYGDTDMTGMVDANGVLTIAPSSVTADETMTVTFSSDEPPVAPSIVKAAAVETGDYTTGSGTYPSAVLYLQVSGGTDGSTLQQTGTVLRAEGKDNTISLVAKNAESADLNQAGFFGIRVFGEAFKGGTYYFKPFVTYEDGEGEEQTTYEEEETSFTLGNE